MPTRILILGGGFAGVKCAQTLRQHLGPDTAEILLFNRENHPVFSPLLADAVGSSLSPLDVVVPLRELLPGIRCRTEEVRVIDLDANEIETENHDGQPRRTQFDHLVIACGSAANLGVVPGMADHAFPLKTVGDASVLRSHVLQQLELAEVCDDPARRRWHLSFIIVGGGYSGVEVAGEINDLLQGSLRFFTNLRADEASVTLIHSRDQILPDIGDGLREFARKKMLQSGVQLLLNARVQLATPDGVGLGDGTFIRGATIVCTIGSTPPPVLERLNVPKEKGRLVTTPDLRLTGRTNVWAVGDCAHILNGADGKPCPPTGQFAERQGRQVAENIIRALRGYGATPFAYQPVGQLCSIGGQCAVAEMFGHQLSGFIAWFIWRGVYLFKLPLWSRRFQVGFDWAWLLLFPRDLSHLRTTVTDRVNHAHYKPGDVIIRQGDPPTDFYVIEQGEVEVARTTPAHPDGEVVTVLGPGSFFGEKALLNSEPRSATVRARTDVEVLVLGRNVFTQLSAALAPLRNALARTLNRRLLDPWQNQPGARERLARTLVRDLLEPAPQPLLKPTTTFAEALAAFAGATSDFLFISADGATLDGIVTLTDLGQEQTRQTPRTTPLSKFMSDKPVAIALDDTAVTAANTLREYRLTTLPVVDSRSTRRLAGVISTRRLTAIVLRDVEVV
ncbi:hypothetical protein LBMAG56_40970 [Verrucomicrobiota bacterium]|nr:hypothetical protein LBMAG56_40970 [Verrucomicrobiota bacterium]